MARASIRIKKGDVVYVLSGKEKGKTGKILARRPKSRMGGNKPGAGADRRCRSSHL